MRLFDAILGSLLIGDDFNWGDVVLVYGLLCRIIRIWIEINESCGCA